MAKIILLEKLGKSDYSNPSALGLIGLFSTLGKAIEGVVAERLAI